MSEAVDQRSWVGQRWDSFWGLTLQGESQRFSVLAATSSFFLTKRVFTAINPTAVAVVIGTIPLVSESIFDRWYENSPKSNEKSFLFWNCRYIVTVSLEVLAASAWMSSVQAIAFIAITNLTANFAGAVVNACLAGYQLWTAKPEDDGAATAAGNGAVNRAGGGRHDARAIGGGHDAGAVSEDDDADDTTDSGSDNGMGIGAVDQ